MAVYRDAHEDILMTCPYNPLHRPAKRRYQIHIASCAKMIGPGWAICPFNQTHRIKAQDKKMHMITCPDNQQMRREMQEKAALKQSGSVTGFTPLPVIGMSNPSEAVDPWAAEGEADNQPNFRIKGLGKDFDVEDFINNPDPNVPIDNICIQRLTKAQKKAYYSNRREAIAKNRNDREEEERKRQEEEEMQRLKSLSWGEWIPPPAAPTATVTGPRMQAPVSKSPPLLGLARHQPYTRPAVIEKSAGLPQANRIGGMGRGKSWANVADNN